MTHPIVIDGLSVSYDKKRVLSNVYLRLEEGKLIGVLGPNGAGKSTLFKAILGLIGSNAGNIKIYGEDIRENRKRMAYVPQRDEVDWTFPATVKDILMLDEPFVGVDITTEEHIIRVLRKLSHEGKTLLVVHHDLSSVKAYFDQVILINQRLIAYGDTESTFVADNIAKTYGAPHTILLEAGHVR